MNPGDVKAYNDHYRKIEDEKRRQRLEKQADYRRWLAQKITNVTENGNYLVDPRTLEIIISSQIHGAESIYKNCVEMTAFQYNSCIDGAIQRKKQEIQMLENRKVETPSVIRRWL